MRASDTGARQEDVLERRRAALQSTDADAERNARVAHGVGDRHLVAVDDELEADELDVEIARPERGGQVVDTIVGLDDERAATATQLLERAGAHDGAAGEDEHG